MSLLLSNTIKSASPERKSKILFIYAISLVGCIVLFFYGLINILVEDYPAAYFELFLSISLLLCIFIIRGSKNTRIAENIGSSVAFVIAFHNFYSGGFGETGLFWVYLFPAIIFFVKGKKDGLRWLFIFYTLLVGIVFIHVYLPNTDILPYQNLTIITFLVSFITISFFIYFYQLTQENTQILLRSKKTLEHTNEDLKSLIIKRKRTESHMFKILA